MTGTIAEVSRCRICSGPLGLARRGRDARALAAGFVPTCHRPGAHGDLYRCRECGTVQQPSLPRGGALRQLYREMPMRRFGAVVLALGAGGSSMRTPQRARTMRKRGKSGTEREGS